MKRISRAMLMAMLGAALSVPAFAGSMDHGSMKGMEMKGSDHGEMTGHEGGAGHEGHMGVLIRETTVEGHRLAYHLVDNAAQMAKMKDMKGTSMGGHDMSKMKSHHLMLYIVGPDGKPVTDAKVGYKLEGPGGEQKTMAMGMEGGFGADVDLKSRGTYEIKTKAVAGGTTIADQFKYDGQ